MKKRRLFSAILIAAMALTMTACDEETPVNPGNNGSPVAASTPSSFETTTSFEENQGVNDAVAQITDGLDDPDLEVTKRIKWMGHYDIDETTAGAILFKNTYGIPAEGDNPESEGRIFEYYKVAYADRYDKLGAAISSGDSPDLFPFDAQDYPYGVLKGRYQPIDELINLDSAKWQYTKELMDLYKLNGRYYCAFWDVSINNVMYYRKSMIEEIAVEDPRDLFKAGKWTWDKARNCSTSFTAQTPHKLSESAVKEVSRRLGSFKTRDEKHIPEFRDYLGWCTWDTFYGAVDEEKVIIGLESFKKADFPLGFMILDDGSWDTYYDTLNSAAANPNKFSDGLHGLIKNAKENYGIKIFGIWHCFEGYWGGIKPDGEVAKKYRLIKNEANIRPWEEKEVIQDIYLIHPDEAERFYEELHSYLHGEGVDMLKIDGQSAMDLFTKGKIGQGGSMKKYQQAMQKSAEKYFGSRVIHCMSNSNDVAYNMLTTNCWRNSYDYAPKDIKMQQEHIYINAMNAMWSHTFSVPDWDMFQSHSAGAEIHAAARAISGGPIYVCDYPGKQDFGIFEKLVTSDGKTLRCDAYALPTEDCLFVDHRREKKLLKIYNYCGSVGVLGIFNCCCDEKIAGELSARDIPDLDGERFAVYFNRTGKLISAGITDTLHAEITGSEYELVSFSPITNGIAPLGLIDKYNNSAAIISLAETDRGVTAKIRDGGKIGFYCEKEPVKVLCCGEKAEYFYDGDTGMVIVNSDRSGINTVEISL